MKEIVQNYTYLQNENQKYFPKMKLHCKETNKGKFNGFDLNIDVAPACDEEIEHAERDEEVNGAIGRLNDVYIEILDNIIDGLEDESRFCHDPILNNMKKCFDIQYIYDTLKDADENTIKQHGEDDLKR